MKSALFIDFDNVITQLEQLNGGLKDRFARNPMQWIQWLERNLETHASAGGGHRRIISRRCYLNPRCYAQYRPFFVRAGFEVIDCPQLTAQGKTSADVHIVLDMVDLLYHEVPIDEVIVMSADADFRPVLMRMRRWDVRTTVLAIGPAATSYKSAADLVIDSEAFFEEALACPTAHSGNYRRNNGSESPPKATACTKASSYADCVTKLVAAAPEPVPLGAVAHELRQEFPELRDNWQGARSLKAFLAKLNLGDLAISPVIPGYAYLPERHQQPVARKIAAPDFNGIAPEIISVATLLHDLLDAPLLRPDQYAILFEVIANEVNQCGLHRTDTSRIVRDQSCERQIPLNRQQAVFVLNCLFPDGARALNGEDPRILAETYRESLIGLCRKQEVQLTPADADAVDAWVSNKSEFHVGLRRPNEEYPPQK